MTSVGRSYRIPLPALAAASLVLVTTALAIVFYVVPNDADQGFSQRIFYFHVPIAFTAYACFAGGAWKALRHLWKRDPHADLESYVAVHQGLIFGSLVLITGSIWAKISWGHWWLWSEDQLVLFLVLFLFYCRVLHAALLRRSGPAAREPQRGVRAVRRRAHSGELPRDPHREALHPSHRVHEQREPQPSPAGCSSRTASRRWRCSSSRTRSTASSSSGKRLDARLRELRAA